jgi:putative tryptophan/tyrosine transport system substrate-binding protein
MRRRTFIEGLGSAAAWPLVARAQQPSMPVVGYFSAGLRESDAARVRALQQGLSETAFVAGQNVSIEYRWSSRHRIQPWRTGARGIAN